MQSIVFCKVRTKSHPHLYKYTIQSSYILGFTTVSIGIGEGIYNLPAYYKTISSFIKIRYINSIGEEKSKEIVNELGDLLKFLNKIPRKSSKEIVSIKQSESIINKIFLLEIEDFFEKLEPLFGIKTMMGFFNSDDFFSYIIEEEDRLSSHEIVVSEVDLLQLLLPKEKGTPLLFLNVPWSTGIIGHLNAEDQEATSLSEIYASNLLNIPNLSIITSNQIELVRDDLKIGSKEFRAKLNQWATICYENPNTTLGLDYFRANLLALEETADDLASQSPTLNSFSEATNHKGKVSLLFGEAPIEYIWKNYLDTETISQEIFDKLLEIKKEQAPKFDGRWPVAFLKAFDKTEDLNEESEDTNSEIAIRSVRKSISLE